MHGGKLGSGGSSCPLFVLDYINPLEQPLVAHFQNREGYRGDMVSVVEKMTLWNVHQVQVEVGNLSHKTRAYSSYDTFDEVERAKSQDIIWYEL